MFRNNRSSSNPVRPESVNRNPTNAAASAAALAFLKTQQSNTALSAAAAAAALRSHASSPVPIGEIVTKRMQRRGSTSSFGSAAGSIRAPFGGGLQRRPSNSSMTERTFRSPSPSVRSRAPPMPSAQYNIPPIPQKSQKRSSSLEPPFRVTSPTPSTGGRTSVAKKVAYGGLANVPEQREREYVEDLRNPRNSNNVNNVNYSRPMSPPLSTRPPRERVQQRPASSQGFYTSPSASRTQQSGQGSHQVPAAKGARTSRQIATNGSIQRINEVPDALTAASLAAQPTSAVKAKRSNTGSMVNAPPASRSTPSSQQSNGNDRVQRPRGDSTSSNSAMRPMSPPLSARPQSQPTFVNSTDPQRKKKVKLDVLTEGVPDKTGSQASPNANGSVTLPSPSAEQMRVFHTRAAGFLAPSTSEVGASNHGVSQAVGRDGAHADPWTQQGSTSVIAQQHSRTVSQPVPNLSAPSAASGNVRRTPSVSPARSARFSHSPLLDAVKHQPPPRAMSPAKSALKPSSLRTSSPSGSVRQMPNENSDARSFMSEDAGVAGPRKKIKPRVSFNQTSELIEDTPAPITVNEGTWNGDTDQGMSPRPALPSFGSVRGKKNGKSSKSAPEPVAHSSLPNPALTSILAQLPPSRGSDPTASTPAEDRMADHAVAQEVSVVAPEVSVSAPPGDQDYADTVPKATMADELVPAISVLPATPHPEDDQIGMASHAASAGNFTDQPVFAGDHEAVATTAPLMEHMQPASGDFRDDFAKPVEPIHHADESAPSESDYGDAGDNETTQHYADADVDAIEDKSEVGYPSLTAILEGPAAEPGLGISGGQVTNGVSNAVTHATAPGESDAAPGEDWERVRAYWSSLSEQRKLQLEHEAARLLEKQKVDEVPVTEPAPRAVNEPIPGPYRPSGAVTAGRAPLPPWPDQQYQQSVTKTQPPKQATRPKNGPPGPDAVYARPRPRNGPSGPDAAQARPRSKNGPPGSDVAQSRPPPREDPKMRKSMRGPVTEPIGVRPQSAQGPARTSVQHGTRPASASANHVPLPRATMTPSPALKPALKKTAEQPPLARTFSNGSSASESSFRKKRRGSTANAEGRYTMKRTMRAPAEVAPPVEAQPTSPISSRPDRMTMRSPSPSTSTTALRTTMRTTMRASVDSSRPDQPTTTTPAGLGFGRSSKQKSLVPKSKSRFSSRFRDSSEDEGAGQGVFRSRFADSDDEDEMTSPVSRSSKFAPMRGFRRKAGQTAGETTSLSDIEDGPGAAAPQAAYATPATPPMANGYLEGTALSAGTLRQSIDAGSPKVKQGLFGFGKRVDAPTGTMVSGANSMPNTPTKSRPKELLRRLSLSRSGATTPNGEFVTQEHPFPPPPIPDEYKQEYAVATSTSAGGLAAAKAAAVEPSRPDTGSKGESIQSSGSNRPVIVSARTGKQKRFQGLRRMFGMKD